MARSIKKGPFIDGHLAKKIEVTVAQAKKNEPPPEEQKGYTLPYFFTLVGVLAAIVPICMPCNRKWNFDASEEEK